MTEARVVDVKDVPPVDVDGAVVRTLISPETGSEQLLQRVIEIAPGANVPFALGNADDVLYVVQGYGTLHWAEDAPKRCAVSPGAAFLVRDHVPARLEPADDHGLVVVSVLSPPPFHGGSYAFARLVAPVVVHEDKQVRLPAGDDRNFKLLIGPEHGARNVTQFVGFIERSKAPLHTHTYEEAVSILDGDGVVHIGGDREERIGPGTSIFLPPRAPHSLENRSERTLKLLGVFSPPGSPAAKREC